MPQYMKKGGFGRMVTADGGATDPELFEVRYTANEYKNQMKEIAELKRQLQDEQASHKRDVEAIKTKAVQYKKNADLEAEKRINQAREALEAANEQRNDAEIALSREIRMNDNLLRIAKERANAKRGMQPKKQRSGYRFVGKVMQTKTISGHDKAEGAIYTDVWSATIETPYNATIPIQEIMPVIFRDLDGGNTGILIDLGITRWVYENSVELWKGTYSQAMENAKKFHYENRNILFDYKMMANPKSGFWEIQITTTKPIPVIPDLM